jgi:hypothetical protein
MNDILLLVAGLAVFAFSGITFWYLLPRDGKVYRLADTPWEPYVGVAFCAGFALGFSMILSSAIDLFG